MRKAFLILPMLLLAGFAQAQTANVTFQWDHDGANTVGFELEILRAGETSPQVIDIAGSGIRTHSIALGAGVYTAKLRAYNTGTPNTLKVYSPYSNDVTFNVPIAPTAPTTLRITITISINNP